MPTNKASIILDADSRRLRQELNAVTGQMRRLEADTRKVGQGMTRAFSGLTGVLAGLGVAAAFRAVLKATTEQEAALRQVQARIKSTGGAAGVTADQLSDMSGQFQSMTTFADDAVLAMQSVLLSFTNIRGDNFRRTTAAVLDLSTALGKDLNSAALIMGKALNSPIKGLGALSRIGVTFSDGQKAVIKSLVETGRVAEAQALILKEVETRFGGAAEAARDTFGGALTALKVQLGDLLEAHTGLPGAAAEINKLTDLLKDPATVAAADKFMSGLITGAAELIGDLPALIDQLRQIADLIGIVAGAWAGKKLGGPLGALGGAALVAGNQASRDTKGALGLSINDLLARTAEPGTGRSERTPRPAPAPEPLKPPPPLTDFTPSAKDASAANAAAGAANRLRLAREIADAELAIQKDSLQRQATQYQNLLDDRLISVAEFYAHKTALDLAQVDAEIARQRQVLDDARAIASNAGTEDDRLRALAQVAQAEADLTVLQARRGDVQVANARAATEAEKDLRASLDEVKTSVLDLQSALAGGAPQIDLEISLARAQAEYQRILDIARQLQGVERDRAEALAEQFLALSRQQAVVQALQQHAEKLADAQQAAEGITRATIDAGHASGALTDLEALRATGEANRAVLEQLGQIRDAYLAMGEAGATAAAQVQAQMIGLAGQLDPVGAEIRGIFGDALSGFFDSFAGESQSWKDRFLGLAGDIVGELQRMFSLELSQQLLKSVSGLFGGQQAEAALAATTLTTGAATAATALGAGAATAGGALGAGGTTAAAALSAGGASAAAAMIAGATSAAAILAGAQAASAAGGSAGLLAGLFHSGGIVGAPGPVLRMPAIAFATAPRYHSGGVAGLAPDEVPAVLRSGEEVLTAADPRHRSNGGLAPAAPANVNIRNINLFDTQEISNYLTSSAGERVVLNIMSRNKAVLA